MRRRQWLAMLAMTPVITRANVPLRVLASFSILADLVRQIGGQTVVVDSMVGPNEDTHVYDPKPRDLRTLLAADVLVRNGLGLEGWMDRLTSAAGFKGRVVVATEKVTPRNMKEKGVIATDPHAWQDPRNAILYVQAIAEGLIAADPANAMTYDGNLRTYSARIAETDAWITSTLAPIAAAQRRIITTHDAFGYYGARYGIEFLSAQGISTEAEPSAKAIATLVAQIKRERVRAVFIENMTIDRIALRAGHFCQNEPGPCRGEAHHVRPVRADVRLADPPPAVQRPAPLCVGIAGQRHPPALGSGPG